MNQNNQNRGGERGQRPQKSQGNKSGQGGGGIKFDVPTIEIAAPPSEAISKVNGQIRQLPHSLHDQPQATEKMEGWLNALLEDQRLFFYRQATALEEDALFSALTAIVLADSEEKQRQAALESGLLPKENLLEKAKAKFWLLLEYLSNQPAPPQLKVETTRGVLVTDKDSRQKEWQATVEEFRRWLEEEKERGKTIAIFLAPQKTQEALNHLVNLIVLPPEQRLNYGS